MAQCIKTDCPVSIFRAARFNFYEDVFRTLRDVPPDLSPRIQSVIPGDSLPVLPVYPVFFDQIVQHLGLRGHLLA
ncbi:hypothetical protein SDC9_206696 [bioreactor metagenome]|uniref:Uncharacterized protein n=1 Tax=bioreactor metagenome TaxID=1076179 RepID=A0A645J8F0_9ZZZZ